MRHFDRASNLRIGTLACFLLLLCCGSGPTAVAEEDGPSPEEIRAAVTKSLPLLIAGAEGSRQQRKQCFTCHNQGVPLFALSAAQSRGFEVDPEFFQTQRTFIAAFVQRNQQKFLEGKGTGGQADTAGYALWTLDTAGWQADEATAAVTEYFLLFQRERDHWDPVSRRPPTEASAFTTSYVALRGLHTYGTPAQQDRIAQRTAQVRDWLIRSEPKDTEDHVFRLRALALAAAPDEALRSAAASLLALQHPQGGWAQLPDLGPDAYATGTALVALQQTGQLASEAPAYRQGLRFLLDTQQADGSWHVKSRSKPFQIYFESGYPHGKDQFVSIAAGGWATTALCLALPLEEALAPARRPRVQPLVETQPVSLKGG